MGTAVLFGRDTGERDLNASAMALVTPPPLEEEEEDETPLLDDDAEEEEEDEAGISGFVDWPGEEDGTMGDGVRNIVRMPSNSLAWNQASFTFERSTPPSV